jgi:hypothetical protein
VSALGDFTRQIALPTPGWKQSSDRKIRVGRQFGDSRSHERTSRGHHSKSVDQQRISHRTSTRDNLLVDDVG